MNEDKNKNKSKVEKYFLYTYALLYCIELCFILSLSYHYILCYVDNE